MLEFYLSNEYWFAATQLILAMFGMGATLTPKDFKDVFVEPLAVTSGTVIQLAAVPLATFVFLSAFDINAGVAVGIALIAAIPGGTASNIFTFFARGNAALSISITAITTLLCILTTPFILGILINQYLPADFVMPSAKIMREISLTLLVPLTAGMIFYYFQPKLAGILSKISIRISLIIILAIVIGSAMAGRLDLEAFGYNNVGIIFCFTLLLAIVAYTAPRIIGLNRANCGAIEFEVVVRNINLGVLINASIFPLDPSTAALGTLVLVSLLLYGGIMLLMSAVLIAFYRFRV
jgi:BASS family bile acid:Na+ symporter